MSAASTPIAWHGLELLPAAGEGAQTVAALLGRSAFALVAAERAHELPPTVACEPVAANRLEASSDLMPRLVALAGLSQVQYAELLDIVTEQHMRGEQSLFAALLDTSASESMVAAHLRRVQARSRAGQNGWLRLHDPYVFVQLPRVLGGAAVSTLFGPVRCWSICLAGQWWLARAQTNSGNAAPDAPIDARTQWDGLLRIAPVNRALHHLQARALQSIVEFSAHLDSLVVRAAARHGLTRAADQAAFAALAVDLVLNFDEHPDVAAAIARRDDESQRSEAPDASVVDVLTNLPEATWQRIRAAYARSTGPSA